MQIYSRMTKIVWKTEETLPLVNGILSYFLRFAKSCERISNKTASFKTVVSRTINKEKRKGDIRNSQSVIRRPWLRMKRHLAQGRSCISCTFVSFSLRAAHVRQKRARFYLTFHDDFIVARFRASFLRFPARNLSASIGTRVTSLINVKLRFHWRDACWRDNVHRILEFGFSIFESRS